MHYYLRHWNDALRRRLEDRVLRPSPAGPGATNLGHEKAEFALSSCIHALKGGGVTDKLVQRYSRYSPDSSSSGLKWP